MANPITWQNVQSRGDGGAAALLEGARRSINDGMAAFKGEIDTAEGIRDANFTNQGKNNTQAYLDALSQYRTVGDLEGGRAQLDTLAASLGPNVDKNVLRTGFDDRLGALRTDANQAYDYNQTQLDQQANPLLEKIRALMVTDPNAAMALANENKDLLTNSGDFANLIGSADNQTELLKDRGIADENRRRDNVNYAFESDERARNFSARKQTEYMDKVLGDYMAGDPKSAVEAGQFMFQEAAKAGIPNEIAMQASQRAREAYAAKYDLDADQMNDLRQAEVAGQNYLTNAIAQNESMWAEAQRDYPVDPAYTYNAANTKKLEDAITVAQENGWDPSNVSDRLNMVRSEMLKEFPALADEKNPDTEGLNMLDTLITRATSRLGKKGDNLLSRNDLPTSKVLKYAKDEMAAYMQNKDNLVKQREVKQVYDASMAAALTESSEIPNRVLDQYTRSNKAVRTIGSSRSN